MPRARARRSGAGARGWRPAVLAASGVGRTEIAERLGVSLASVHNYLNAHRCPGCAGR